MSATLAAPFRHAAVIEGTLLNAFPAVWNGVYYFSPERQRRSDEESNAVFNLIRANHDDVNLRALQNFHHQVKIAVDNGRGRTIPLSGQNKRIACYVMTERDNGPERLRDFFNAATVDTYGAGRLGRLFEEYVTRHEVYHTVEMLEPGFHGRHKYTAHESENGADAFSLLGMAQEHGAPVLPFADALITARTQHAVTHPEYDTVRSIAAAADFIRAKGDRGMAAMDDKALFYQAQRLARGALRMS